MNKLGFCRIDPFSNAPNPKGSEKVLVFSISSLWAAEFRKFLGDENCNSKRYYLKSLVHLFVLMLSFNISVFAQNQLQIKIRNIEIIEGELFIQLSSDTAMFKKTASLKPFIERKIVNDSVMTITFNNLEDGEYAFAIFQDLNGNESLDRKKFGIPAEPFAFSKNALGKFGPPKFEDASFEIKGGGKHYQEVKLLYRKPKKEKDD